MKTETLLYIAAAITGVIVSIGIGYLISQYSGSLSMTERLNQTVARLEYAAVKLENLYAGQENTLEQQADVMDTPPEGVDVQTWQKFLISLSSIDYHLIEKLIEDVFLGNTGVRVSAIQVLGRVGSPEIKEEIRKFALNETEELEVRVSAVEALDWQKMPGDLINLVQVNDSRLREAVIVSLNALKLDTTYREQVNHLLYAAYQKEINTHVQIAILDYFNAYDTGLLEDLLIQIPVDKLSPEVAEHLQYYRITE